MTRIHTFLAAIFILLGAYNSALARVDWCPSFLRSEAKILGEYETLVKKYTTTPEFIGRLQLNSDLLISNEIYSVFSKNQDYLKALIFSWYQKDGAALIHMFENELGTQSLPLLLHPGVASHYKEAIIFFKSGGLNVLIKTGEYEKAIAVFRKMLGTTTVYRGMRVDTEKLEYLLKSGIDAPLFYSRKPEKIVDYFDINATKPMNPFKDIFTRINSKYENPMPASMSLTEDKDVAVGVAKDFHTRGELVVLFTIEVPILDMIRREGVFEMDWIMDKYRVFIDDKFVMKATDSKLEQFIFYKIQPSMIKGHQIFSYENVKDIRFKK